MTIATTNSPPGAALAVGDTAAISNAVHAYAADLMQCGEFAKMIVDTPFVPAAWWPNAIVANGDNAVVELKPKDWNPQRRHPKETDEAFGWRRNQAIATTATIVYAGATLGLNWQAALAGIYVANGRASLYAEQMRALVLAAGHKFDVGEWTAESCTVIVRRRDDVADTVVTFSMDDAILAGYVQGKGPNTGEKWRGNAKYNTDPKAMLFARATTIACKAKFADVIKGMQAAEIADDEPVDVTATAEVRPVVETPKQVGAVVVAGALRGQRLDEVLAPVASDPVGNHATAPAEVVADTAPPPVEADVPEAPGPGVDMLTDRQFDQLGQVFAKLGVTGPGSRARRGLILSKLMGRELVSSRAMTADEGQLALDTLTAIARRSTAADRAEGLAEILAGPGDSQEHVVIAGEVDYPAEDDGQAAVLEGHPGGIDPTIDDPWADQ